MARAEEIGGARKLGLLAVPGIVVSVLPTLTCPLCWPAYAALLSSLGLSFLASSAYLLPLTAVLLALAVAGLGLQAKTNGHGPFLVGLLSAAPILAGKFLLGSTAMTDGGVAALVAASLWSIAPNRPRPSADCPTCRPIGPNKETAP